MKKYLYYMLAAITIWSAAGASVQAEEVVVNKGDTLWSIAQKHEVSVQDIKNWNGLSTNLIHPNDKLEVSPEEFYIVKSGDTLWNIAHTYGVNVQSLKSWNQLSSDLIRPGLELIIYRNAAGQAKAAAPAKTVVKSANTVQPAAEKSKSLTVTATAYTASCEGCIGITKTGVNLLENPDAKVIAVDPNVIPLGSKVYVEGYGYATAEDIGGGIKGNEIDVFIPTTEAAMEFGRKDVKVTILN
ncbi:3D (Asp-Asp-Asp) domain-containing protein [Cytobacillus oceanisediminis]|jgi:3D (Asp-Asp-Asp) domain-containing protein|uniref:3D (Asp-Asp-Asp) domain-containing protein n=1 Tax=Cytobacillus oceanisediminis TaxID=665099 RepID=A0A2V3A310_9BACI|nr:3D domain-containing protein [Cytobacillus oceanisediminis]PWW31196.1 3D (Asp-Asp-Asp) domain-containing protein [Cytobacillus oceanisediminis]